MNLIYALLALTVACRFHGTDDAVRATARSLLAKIESMPPAERPPKATGLVRMAISSKAPMAFLKAVHQELGDQDLIGIL